MDLLFNITIICFFNYIFIIFKNNNKEKLKNLIVVKIILY